MQNAECRMQNAECRMQILRFYRIVKFMKKQIYKIPLSVFRTGSQGLAPARPSLAVFL